MSSISSIGGGCGASSIQSLSGNRGAQRSNPLKDQLDQMVSSSGLDDTQKTSLRNDLQTAIKSVFQSGSFPPDPSAIQDAISGVFDKYGMDGESLASELKPPERGGGGGGGFQQKLDSLLSSTDLDDSQKSSLESDLKAAFQSLRDSSSDGSRPDPETADKAVSAVFSKYGLDGDKFASELRPPQGAGGPPPGPPPGGGPPGAGSSSSSSDSTSSTSSDDSLSQLLQQLLDQLKDGDNSGNSQSVTDFLMTAFVKLDTSA